MALFLIMLPALLWDRGQKGDRQAGPLMAAGLLLAIALSVLLRALGATMDLSNEGWFRLIALLLAAATAIMLPGVFRAEPQDRRSFRVVATPAGMDIVNALEPGGRDFFLSQVGPLADPQLQQFADALALVLEVLRHDGEAPAELVAANAVAS